MLTRRRLVVAALATAGLARLGWIDPARAQSPAEASAFVEQTGRALTAVANGPGSTEAKRSQLDAIVERSVDVDGVARFCLGRFWQGASPAQRQEYLTLFHRVLATSITGHLGDYRGVGFTMGRLARPRVMLRSAPWSPARTRRPPTCSGWWTRWAASRRSSTLLAEGTSLRLTQRSDYASFLSRNGNNLQALIDAIRRQLGA